MLLFGEAAATDVRAAATGTRGCNAAAGGVWYARNCRQYRWAAGRLLLREGAAASRASSGLMLQGRGCYWLGVRLLPRWARLLLGGWADAIGRGVAATCGGAGGRLPPVGGCCCRRACGCSYSSCGCSRRGAPTPGGLLPVQGGGRDRWAAVLRGPAAVTRSKGVSGVGSVSRGCYGNHPGCFCRVAPFHAPA